MRGRTPVNEEISATRVSVLSRQDGAPLGAMTVREAPAIARRRGEDLVSCASRGNDLPVCEIIDAGRMVYEVEMGMAVSAAAGMYGP